MLTPFSRGLEGRERRVVLPRGLADRGAHHDLEDLVLAETTSRSGSSALYFIPNTVTSAFQRIRRSRRT
jgi:hypothetical protein